MHRSVVRHSSKSRNEHTVQLHGWSHASDICSLVNLPVSMLMRPISSTRNERPSRCNRPVCALKSEQGNHHCKSSWFCSACRCHKAARWMEIWMHWCQGLWWSHWEVHFNWNVNITQGYTCGTPCDRQRICNYHLKMKFLNSFLLMPRLTR